MPLQSLEIPASVQSNLLDDRTTALIDAGNECIEALLLADDSITDQYIPCDFHLFAQTLDWILESDLIRSQRFCELGSGLGVAVAIAAARGMDSVGIEIEGSLVEKSKVFVANQSLESIFHHASFVPADAANRGEVLAGFEESNPSIRSIGEGDVPALSDFDLLFVYPWPDQIPLFEALFETYAKPGALMLIYRGSKGMRLLQKS